MKLALSRPAFVALIALSLCVAADVFAADKGLSADALAKKPDEWFKSDEAKTLLRRLLTYQTPAGGWAKGYSLSTDRDATRGPDGYGTWGGIATIDNGCTYTEIRLLSRAATITGDKTWSDAAIKGIDFLLDRQYDNGGWPQRSPKDGDRTYGSHITYNDNAMISVMQLLQDAGSGQQPFQRVDEARRARCRKAFDRGVECILNTQVKVNGQLTAWCQQHDEKTLQPAAARAYELPSLSGAESAGILRLLMSIEKPDDRVRQAVHGACAWFERSKIVGKREKVEQVPDAPKGKDKVLVDDPAAPPLWARFYDIETNRPFYCSRDGVKKFAISEISHERRNGYGWHGSWGNDVLKTYAKWKQKVESPK